MPMALLLPAATTTTGCGTTLNLLVTVGLGYTPGARWNRRFYGIDNYSNQLNNK